MDFKETYTTKLLVEHAKKYIDKYLENNDLNDLQKAQNLIDWVCPRYQNKIPSVFKEISMGYDTNYKSEPDQNTKYELTPIE